MKRKLIQTFPEVRFFKWEINDVSVSLRNKSGSYGGGSEVLVVEEVIDMSENQQSERCAVMTQNTSTINMQRKVRCWFLKVSRIDYKWWDGGDTASTLTARCMSQYMPDKDNFYATVGEEMAEKKYIVRRLTPLECERLQNFPDNWTDIGEWIDSKGSKRKTADSNRYKALGNSIATGPNSYWKFVLKRISALYDYEPTMGSLFDGIGGFPLIWEQINGKGSCRWASEIDEFCVAVTKKHFGEE